MSGDESHALDLVERWMRTHDPALLGPAIEAMSAVVADARARRRPDHESEYILTPLLMTRAEQPGRLADLDTAITLMRRTALETHDTAALSWLGRALVARYQKAPEQADLDEALDVLYRAVAGAPTGDQHYPAMVTDLLKVSWLPLSQTGDVTPLSAAISIAQRAFRLVSDDHPGKPEMAVALVSGLWHRHDRAGRTDDAGVVIDMCRKALRLRSAGPETRSRLSNRLADALLSRYQTSKDPADLDEAITIHMAAHDPRSARRLFDLGHALHTRFERDGRLDDLRAAAELLQGAVDAATPDDTERLIYQAGLLVYLGELSQYTADSTDSDAEIAKIRQLARTPSSEDAQQEMLLNHLGYLLYTRYEDHRDEADLLESVEVLREATAIAARTGDVHVGDSTRVRLGFSLVALFDLTGDLAALDEALEIGRSDGLRAVQRSDDGQVRFTPIVSAGDWRRDRLGSRDDGKSRVGLTSVLAHAMATRYEQTGDFADLDDALTLATTALELAAASDPPRQVEATGQLCRIYALRHERTRDRADLVRAIESAERLVAVLPADNRQRTTALSNLTALLIRRYHADQDPADLEYAIQAAQEALDSTPANRPAACASAQAALAHALLERVDRPTRGTAELAPAIDPARTADLARAVDLARSAARGATEDLLATGERLDVLMSALCARYDRTPNEADLAEVIDLAWQVLRADSGRPSSSLETVERCASWAAGHGAWEPAAELYEACVDLMAALASPDRHSETRRYWLSKWALLTRRASACALNVGDPRRAAALLERGRGVLLSQRFDLRTDLADLRAVDDDLAERLEVLRGRLYDVPLLGAGPAPRIYALDSDKEPPDVGSQRRRWLREYGELLAEVRSKPGFEQYLRPVQWDELIAQASPGPVVVPTISEFRSDALILSDGGLRTVELPHATPEALQHAVSCMLSALKRSKTAWLHRDRDSQLHAQSEIGAVLAWLWDAIAEPVLEELGLTGPPEPHQPWPRLWWVPTGQLSLLPLHAAQRSEQCVLDRAISSYAPTVRALSVARAQRPPRNRSILAVAMPATPGASPLPFADRETVALAERFGGIVILSGPQATRERVRAQMPEHSWAHFACHGWTNTADPGADLLLLHDHRHHPFTISEIADLRLNDAELAYLSACETARAADGLADEAVHLGSAFQLAGYQHVVATLWAVRDDVGAELADHFYAHLLDEQAGPAAALHHASRHIRDKFSNFPGLWAAHLHMGP